MTMTNKTLRKITTVIARNREFYIVKDSENRYWGIEKKWFDQNGMLTKQFNGITGHMSKRVQDTINRTLDTIEIDYLKDQGMTNNEAFEYLLKKEWFMKDRKVIA